MALAKTNSECIYLKGNATDYNVEEFTVNVALSPGHAVEIDANDEISVNATQGVSSVLRIALEDENNGGTIDDEYAADAIARTVVPHKGDIVQLRVAAGADSIPNGGRLELAPDGTVENQNTGTAVAQAREAVDNSGGSDEVFIVAQII